LIRSSRNEKSGHGAIVMCNISSLRSPWHRLALRQVSAAPSTRRGCAEADRAGVCTTGVRWRSRRSAHERRGGRPYTSWQEAIVREMRHE